MAEFKLDRFKYSWRGNWAANTSYKRDDIIKLGGKSYVCLVTHTSNQLFRDDLNAILPGSNPPVPQPRWTVMTSGRVFLGEWQSSAVYNQGDIVLYDGTVWACIVSHTSTNFANDVSRWETFAKGISFVGPWETGVDYGHGALVRYNGVVYKCLTAHTSSVLETDISNWEIFYFGDEYRGSWTTSQVYRNNDIVKYGGSLFRCTETHTSGSTFNNSFFSLEFPGTQFEGDWSNFTAYNIGDIIRYGGYLFYAINNNSGSEPSRNPEDSSYDWIVLSETYNFRGKWSISETYRTGDIVQRGGQLFLALKDINLVDGDASTQDYLDTSTWELLAPGKAWAANWSQGNLYSVGDVAYHLGTAYVCNFEHYSSDQNFPGDNGSGIEYWDLVVQAGVPGGLHDKGDLLTYGLSREVVGDGSTLGDTRVPIGNFNDVLSVTEELEVFWRRFLNDAEVIYVGTTGEDRDGYGVSVNRPFRTVRYAADYVEDNYDPLTPVMISVATGRYEEISPISVPAGCAVVGNELRSTTIVACPPLAEYQDDYQYTREWLNYFLTIIFDVIAARPVELYQGSTGEQIFAIPTSNLDAANIIANSVNDFKSFVEFRVANGSVNPVLTGTNNLRTNSIIRNGAIGLSANKEFITQQVLAYLRFNFTNVTFTERKVRADVYALIRGLARDLRYEGNYGGLTAARRYSNAVTGSQNDDIFYMRDTTGLRNCTTEGLTGGLNPPGVFDLYQRPTGGACVSLDPGWGPSDERVWIINRSPYIQNVTNIGTACVGQKIDGSLHNGGNRSMVSNDFTQVLSDGVGAWVSNNGRAELVSVFTYYCQVGYLAEDGGVIRATNGNNSYGKFGAIADGNDPSETPDFVTLFNRNNEAQVASAFSGGLTDRIMIFEYENAGEQYTSATAEVVGAGAGINTVFDDFRDGALFESRLINTKDSGSEGGSNYLTRQGSAQITENAISTIRLSQNDATVFESEILGMRILIISGLGSGQYGYVAAFNPVTKDVTVRKESDGELGWDHLIPGTPVESALDSTATYRIEPRITANHPGFTNSGFDLPNTRTIYDVEFGGTSATYVNLSGGTGTGETFGLPPVAATFTVVRSGSVYEVSMTNPGAGYAVGDELTILGTAVGGIAPANNITITITGITDDSSNSITTFTSRGTPRGGRFVAVAEPNFVLYSDDGGSWTETTTSFVGNFVRVIAGDNKFILVSTNDNKVSYSADGVNWTTRSLPSIEDWVDGAYGNDKFVIISNGNNRVVYSTTGLTYTSVTIPGAVKNWKSITYGLGKFVAVADDRSVAISSDGITWTNTADALPNETWDIISVKYGANRFVALDSTGLCAYSFDGLTWYSGTTAPTPVGVTHVWKSFKYSQGVFFVVGVTDDGLDTTTDFCATTEDGLFWYEGSFTIARNWSAVTFATLSNIPTWVVLSSDSTAQGINHIVTGARAKCRADIFQGSFQQVKIWDPGSGYSEANPVILTITDNQFITEVEIENRIGNGVLAQPSFVNRGAGYRTSTTRVTVAGDGYADIIPEANTITVAGVSVVPGPGVQIRISGILDEESADPTDLLLHNGVEIFDLGDDGSGNGTRLVQMTISPRVRNEYNLAHGTAIELRSRYSQCRITGHDFLDIGTGNFEETNYPEVYAGGRYFIAAPENEVLEQNGGRVFYVSTDQDGNFRTGELFSVQQATGIVTISAEFFDLDGLTEISLGGVRLGGSGAVVSEFSTDPTFAADSNNVVPTQRAIATFLADRLSVGGENLETNQFVAGRVRVGGENNEIDITTERYLNIPVDVTFDGRDQNGNLTSIQGTIVSQMLFLKNYNDTIQ